MQHLKLISLAILVAACIFHVTGFPVGSEQPQSTGYFGYAKGFASHGAALVGSQLPSKETLVNGLYNGAEYVGSGLYAGAEMGRNGIINNLGAGNQFSLERLSKALSSVNTQTLSAALGLPDISKAITDKVDIYGTLQKLLVNQILPVTGSLNYETTVVFLERLVMMVPSLRKTVEGFKIMLYVTKKIQELQKEGKPVDSTTLMKEAVDIYFKDVDPEFKKKLIDLSPLAYNAALGDRDAALKIASVLADRDTILAALAGMGYKAQIDIIITVIGQVSEYAKLVKGTDAAAHQTK